MAKESKTYVCNECGSEHIRWQGQCKDCKEWNTLKEFKTSSDNTKNKVKNAVSKMAGNLSGSEKFRGSRLLSEIKKDLGEESQGIRYDTGKSELNNVLGGGILEGSIILLSGSPGAGKSTLLMEISNTLSKQFSVLYVSGEESQIQLGGRSVRLNVDGENIHVHTEVEINGIIEEIMDKKPKFVVIDSIQTLYNDQSNYALSSIAAIEENAAILNRIGKTHNIAMLIICQINKNGDMAGPKALEHMVDVLCHIENEENSEFRIIRSSKNRFGSANEVGVFKMTEEGMLSVDNPSELFISENRENVSGTSILSTIEGNRPLLIEIQALVSESEFNYPKRLATGLDLNRLNMLIAIMNKHGEVNLADQDVFITAVGGIRLSDTAADLPIVISILSAFLNKSISADIASFGEIDLTGRLRPVSRSEARIKEAISRGFTKILVPYRNVPKDLERFNINIIGIGNVSEIYNHID